MSRSSRFNVSVVITSRNEGEYLASTVESLLSYMPANGEIIVVDDASTDGSSNALAGFDPSVSVLKSPRRIGACVGRNLGAQRAQGKVIVFSDAHIKVKRNWAQPLMAALQRRDTGAVGPTISDMFNPEIKGYGFRFVDAGLNTAWLGCQRKHAYEVPLLGAGFLAMRRDVFLETGGFDEGMVWGMEDLELSVRLWTLGYRCLLAPDVDIAHLDRWGMNPEYQYDWEEGLHNTLRTAVLHFGQDRIRRVIEFYAADHQLPASLSRLITGDTLEKRSRLLAIRAHDDDWYFRKFGMEI